VRFELGILGTHDGSFRKKYQTKELRETELGSVYGEWKTEQPQKRGDLFLTLGHTIIDTPPPVFCKCPPGPAVG